MEDTLNDYGQKTRERKAQKGCKECQEDECGKTLALANEANTLSHALQDGVTRFLRNEAYMNHHERCDNGKVRRSVQCEAPGRPKGGIGQSAERRP